MNPFQKPQDSTNKSLLASLLDVCSQRVSIDIPAWNALSSRFMNLQGSNNGSNASSGNVGEYISANVPYASAVSMSSTLPVNIASISLTAGDWDVNGVVCFLPTGSYSQLLCYISTTSATIPTYPNSGSYTEINTAGSSTGGTPSLPTGPIRISIASTTTVYLGAETTFSTGACTGFGFIGARRAR